MMTIKMNDLLNSIDILQKLSKMELKAKLAWQVARLLKAAEKEIQEFNETRMNVITKYGEKDENDQLITDDDNNCKIQKEHVTDFTNEINELVKSEVEINANKIKIDALEDLEFTPSEMTQLEPYIDFGEDE